MPITPCATTSYKKQIIEGVHSSTDTYKIALYINAATLDAATTVYSPTNEIIADGYTAGGKVLEGFNVVAVGTSVILDFSTDAIWTNASIEAARGALIYNSSKGNKAVLVIDLKKDMYSSNGTFQIIFPTPDATHGLYIIG